MIQDTGANNVWQNDRYLENVVRGMEKKDEEERLVSLSLYVYTGQRRSCQLRRCSNF